MERAQKMEREMKMFPWWGGLYRSFEAIVPAIDTALMRRYTPVK
jgi:hypothetical protein